MLNSVTWIIDHNGQYTPDRRTFVNGYVIHLLDDGYLYSMDEDVYSQYEYQTFDDITYEQLQSFVKLIKQTVQARLQSAK